jgi:hypothetical protein
MHLRVWGYRGTASRTKSNVEEELGGYERIPKNAEDFGPVKLNGHRSSKGSQDNFQMKPSPAEFSRILSGNILEATGYEECALALSRLMRARISNNIEAEESDMGRHQVNKTISRHPT